MREILVAQVREAGLIGAGGAGFPTHVKIDSAPEIVIVNGAECEPLLRVDQQIMVCYAGEVVRGLKRVMEATGAAEGVVALKKKYHRAASSIQKELQGTSGIRVHLLNDFYPAGDEQVLVHLVTGRLVPEGGIPLDVGVLVQNAATMRNIERAGEGVPVTEKIVTVTGAVREPKTVTVPVGASVQFLLDLCGGSFLEEYTVIMGGPMMGHLSSPEDVVDKTTGAIIVLPPDHPVVISRTQNIRTLVRRAKSVCDQCFACTEKCPRYLLGHEIYPHKMMRAVSNNLDLPADQITHAYLCCGCRLCEYACPVLLSPVGLYGEIKKHLARGGVRNPHRRKDFVPHERMSGRRVPMKRLLSFLRLEAYDKEAPLDRELKMPEKVSIRLNQHIGAPALPVVGRGESVTRGDLIAEIPEGKLGARVHASINGTVTEVRERITITRS